MKIKNLKINGMNCPIGYELSECIVTWNVDEAEGGRSERYFVQVSDDEEFGDVLWTEQGERIPAGGVRIQMEFSPMTRYFVKVVVKDDAGDCAEANTWFETGKMDKDWTAEWITYEDQEEWCPVFWKKFAVKGSVAKARLYISAAGVFEAYLNGKKVGEEYLTPYLTDYDKCMQVITYPVEDYLDKKNNLEILAGKGWYMGRFGMPAREKTYGDKMAVIAELHLLYEDGTQEVVSTDKTWQYHGSDIEKSGIYDGEIINRLLWEDDENQDHQVIVTSEDRDNTHKYPRKDRLKDRLSLPIKQKERIPVMEILHTPAGETVLDMGQNFAGFVEFSAAFTPGTKIILEFGEILQNGNFYNDNYRSAAQPFIYVSDGRKETVRAHFTYFGFRYVRVSGWPGGCCKEDFIGIALYSDMKRTGYIQTSDDKINRLYENSVWGMKSNFLDIPTDCPQRDERLGWTGDAQVFASTACYHMDTRAFYRKFIRDLRAEQCCLQGAVPNYLPNPGHAMNVAGIWGDVATILPDAVYKFYGDKVFLAEAYPLMRDWVLYIDREDKKRGQRYLYDFGVTFGDWLALDGMTISSFKGNTDDAYLASVYYFHSADLTRKAAEVLGYEDDRRRFDELCHNIEYAIFREFYTPGGRLAIDTQAAYVAALRFNICPDRQRVIEQFRIRLKKDGYQIRCGFVGAPLLCSVLAENGMQDLAWDILLTEEFPGWLYEVNLGATTIWERWNSVLPDGSINPAGMNSLNHFSYGAVAEFLYEFVCGVKSIKPGFKKVRIAPLPDIRVPYISCDYDSASGHYRVSCRIRSDGMIAVNAEIPFDCEAVIVLPGYEGDPIEVASGKYEYIYKPHNDYRRPYHRNVTLKRISKNAEAMGILGKYAPAYAGIAASGDIEMSANTLEEMSFNDFIPVDREQLEKAMKELEELEVSISVSKVQ